MGLSNKLPDLQEVDVIIAGGGAAGCVLAGRLAAASPSLSILCVEYGPDNYNDPTFTTPGFMLSHLDPSKKTTLFYKGAKSPSTGNRDMVVPSGGVLGGGSSVNFMMYSRAQRSDFDAWDMPGWSADEIMPYLRKLETFHGPDPLNSHGHDGPIQVSKGTWGAKRCQDDFINAIGKLGYPEMDDLQSLSPGAINGVQRAMKYISPDGKRSDAAHAYVHPRLTDGKHPNLHVVVETQVDKVIIENGRAVGVQVLPNPSFHPEDTRVRTIRAKKLVVVSAGACGTPLILERSGVGDPAVLGAAGVDVTVDLPGVGNGYEDHLLQVSVYHTSLGEDETIDAVTRGQRDVAEMMRNNHPMLGWNVQDITCKLRPSDDEVAALGPAFQKAWNEHFRDIPDKPMTLMSPVSGYPGDPSGIPPGQYIGLTTFSVYPFSRGHIHITGPSPSDEPNFDTGFFADPDSIDILKSRWAYKKSREIMRRMSVYRGELASMHPPFQPDSAATCAPVDSCDLETVQDISYSEEDDRIIDEWLRKTIGTTWHSMGTCKMASREKKGVVDEHLSVYGVSGLKVVDLSIAPKNIGANTNNTALAIGERAADIIIKELGL